MPEEEKVVEDSESTESQGTETEATSTETQKTETQTQQPDYQKEIASHKDTISQLQREIEAQKNFMQSFAQRQQQTQVPMDQIRQMHDQDPLKFNLDLMNKMQTDFGQKVAMMEAKLTVEEWKRSNPDLVKYESVVEGCINRINPLECRTPQERLKRATEEARKLIGKIREDGKKETTEVRRNISEAHVPKGEGARQTGEEEEKAESPSEYLASRKKHQERIISRQ